MFSKHISQYTYFHNKLHVAVLKDGTNQQQIRVSKVAPVLRFDNVVTNWELNESTRRLIANMGSYYLVICNLCKYLSIYHLIKFYVDFGADQPYWKIAIAREMKTRITKFNWQCGTCVGSSLKSFHNVEHRVTVSENIYMTQMNSGLTFFDTSFAKRVQFRIPKWHFKESKLFYNYLLEDTTMGMDIPYVCVGMDKIRFFNPASPEYTSSIYVTLYFPPIPEVEIKYCTCPLNFTSLLNSDEHLECLLVFATDDCEAELDHVLNDLILSQSTDIPIAGGCKARKIIKNQFFGEHGYNSYIAITRARNSTANFTAATLVIDQEDNIKDKLIDKNLVRHTEEFCVTFVHNEKTDRDGYWDFLIQLFDFPIVQCEVSGVVGNTNYKPMHRKKWIQPLGKRPRLSFALTHTHACVLLYLGWGKIKNI